MPVPKLARIAPAAAAAALLIAPAAASAVQKSFTAAGVQTFVVPVAVTQVQATLVGGRGGAGSTGSTSLAGGGTGATVRALLAVKPGQALYAQVAGDGQTANAGGLGGFGGGGSGGEVVVLLASAPGGGGGGGASLVRPCPAPCGALAVAAGGGGGGGHGLDSTPSINGGAGGDADEAGLTGEMDATKNDAGGGGGRPGTTAGGGTAGVNSYESPAQPGVAGAGGNGGIAIGGGGGGGGGGIYGGGGGGAGLGFADFNTTRVLQRRRRWRRRRRVRRPRGRGRRVRPRDPRHEAGHGRVRDDLLGAARAGRRDRRRDAVRHDGDAARLGQPEPRRDHRLPLPDHARAAGRRNVPCAQQLGAGGKPVGVSATIAGLAAGTRYIATLSAANAGGTGSGRAVAVATAAAAAPVASGLALSPARFRRGTAAAQLAGARRGTTISFDLSKAASVRLEFKRARPGRRSGGRCVSVTPATRSAPRCTRFARVRGGVRLAAPAGADRIRFEGVLDGGRRLRRGAYRMTLVAVDDTGRRSAPQRARFRIVR